MTERQAPKAAATSAEVGWLEVLVRLLAFAPPYRPCGGDSDEYQQLARFRDVDTWRKVEQHRVINVPGSSQRTTQLGELG